ncbi:MAG: mannose-1-phosphate guanylyltransferase, partial [Candidatus Methylomirabilales bacterium]
ATRLVREGSALWNSGIFLWRCSTFLDACDRYVPGLRQNVEAIAAASTVGGRRRRMKRLFPQLPRISVDYGVLERSREVVVLRVTFPWDDVGSWGALTRLHSLDGHGNAVVGPHVGIDTRGCVIQAAGRVVGTIGLRDLIIVDGPGGLLVAAKERAQEVRALAQRASREGRSRATRRSWE